MGRPEAACRACHGCRVWKRQAVAAGIVRRRGRAAIPGRSGRRAGRQRGRRRKSARASRTVGIINLIGQTDLPALAGVLVQCRALVTNDSGAMHFGAALGLPVTAMFGPTDERETHPIGQRAPIVLTHDVWCRPCMLRECPIDHRCMRGIPVDEVLSAVRRTL